MKGAKFLGSVPRRARRRQRQLTNYLKTKTKDRQAKAKVERPGWLEAFCNALTTACWAGSEAKTIELDCWLWKQEVCLYYPFTCAYISSFLWSKHPRCGALDYTGCEVHYLWRDQPSDAAPQFTPFFRSYLKPISCLRTTDPKYRASIISCLVLQSLSILFCTD